MTSIAWLHFQAHTKQHGWNTNLFQGFSAALYDTVCNFNSRHTARVCCACISIGDISDVFQTELAGVQNSTKCLCDRGYWSQNWRHTHYLVSFRTLHRLFDHYSGVQQFREHARKQTLPHFRLHVHNTIRRDYSRELETSMKPIKEITDLLCGLASFPRVHVVFGDPRHQTYYDPGSRLFSRGRLSSNNCKQS